MRILLTNDDGIFAPGLRMLALSLSKHHELTICAPERECSGVSHAFTFLTPLRAKRVTIDGVDAPAYAISGMPVDCVKLGMHNLMDSPPDMVVSGINAGANLGTDVLYSGTVSAAMEAAILGYPSLAVSCSAFDATHFDTAADYAVSLLPRLQALRAPRGTVFNLNVPNLAAGEIKGLRLAPLGNMEYDTLYERRVDPRGVEYYWLPGYSSLKDCVDMGTDHAWVSQGYATLTPITYDLTNHAFLQEMKTLLD